MSDPSQPLQRARLAHRRGAYVEALALLDQADHPDPDDAERGHARVLRSELLRLTGDLSRARTLAEETLAMARDLGWSEVLPEALRTLGRILVTAGDAATAESSLDHALRLFRDRGDRIGEGRCLRDLATVRERCGDARGAEGDYATALAVFTDLGDPVELGYTHNAIGMLRRQQGDLEAAREAFAQALHDLTAADDPYGRGRAVDGLAHVALAQGDHDRALALGREAVELFERVGYAGGIAAGWNLIGECLRYHGDLEGAEEAYRRALAVSPHLLEESLVLRVNLALVVLQRGLYDDARFLLTDLLDELRPARQRLVIGMCEIYLLPCCAAGGDWAAWDGHWLRGTALLAESGVVDRDIAVCARLAGRLAAAHGTPEACGRAARAHGLALSHWRALDHEAEADREENALRSLAAAGAPVPLGPFDLVEPLGRGSMGEVWLARHRAQGVDVAVKVLSADLSGRVGLQAVIHDEVRAVAGLDHPHVVRVLDQGEVDAAADVMTGGRLTRGSPWVAMELAPRGTLHNLCARLPWAECKPLLLALLDALAHAHARDVIHFDIKPANVLLDGAEPPAPRLTDFGLAGAFRAFAGRRVILGTPAYMAPEQFAGDLRAYGPWTDLYGLGCLAWELVTGMPPFLAESVEAYRGKHAEETLPALKPRVAVPAELESWLGRLLAKDPRDRFRRAADAAWALQGLDDLAQVAASAPEREQSALSAPTTVVLTGWDSSEPMLRPDRPDLPLPDVPPVPMRWRPPRLPDAPAALIGTGLRLTALRSVPLVGRDRDQDLLWAVLRDVALRRQAKIVAISGPAGVGKTRMARWLAERAHELGAAEVIHADPRRGLPGALARWLRCEGLEPEEAVGCIERALVGRVDPVLVHRLAAALDGADVVEATVALLEEVALRRPVVVVLDDAVERLELVALAERLAGAPVPVLVLLTVRQDALPAQPLSAARLDGLLDGAHSTGIGLGALGPRDHASMIRRRLWLAPDLAWTLAARTEGNPRYAVQLVDDLARRDLLAPGPDGFTLYHGTPLEMPSELFYAWRDRIADLLEGLPADATLALAVAAALGAKVQIPEWEAACSALGVQPFPALVVRLRSAELVRNSRRGWRFAHPMIRDAALRMAREQGRLADVHRACATVVAARGRSDEPQLGLHLVHAGDLEASLEPLRRAALATARAGDLRAALELLDRRDDAMRSLALPRTHPRWGEQSLALAFCHGEAGAYGAMEREAQRAVDAARDEGWSELLPEALCLLADADRLEGRHAVALSGYRDGLLAAEGSGDDRVAARCLHGMGAIARTRGRLGEAESAFTRALAAYDRLGIVPPEALDALADVMRCRGELEEAERWYGDALRKVGADQPAARCATLLGLADVARDRGQLDRAEALYREVRSAAGDAISRALMAQLGLCIVDLLRFRLDVVAARLGRVEEHVAGRGGSRARDLVELLHVPLVADADESVWQARCLRAELVLDHRERVEPDVAIILETAARRARTAGRGARVRWALRGAHRQWKGLGREADAERVSRQIARLTSR